MKGYCSNSPNQCGNAAVFKLIHSDNEFCPECQRLLIPDRRNMINWRLIFDLLHWALFLLVIITSLAVLIIF